MNPSSGETQPQFEVPEPAEGPEKRHDKQMEKAGGPSESAAGKQQPQALNTAVLPLPSDIPAAAPVAIPTDISQDAKDHRKDTYSKEAYDSHQIEKQWVERAKKVIAQTKDDPHAQKHKMSQVKAEYIRKRFNKTIPTDGPAAA